MLHSQINPNSPNSPSPSPHNRKGVLMLTTAYPQETYTEPPISTQDIFRLAYQPHHSTELHENIYQRLEKNLPPIFTRKTASQAIGGLISAKTLANLDSLGLGPIRKVKIGLKVGYEREDFIAWLKQRIER